jgi:hypothetical protein
MFVVTEATAIRTAFDQDTTHYPRRDDDDLASAAGPFRFRWAGLVVCLVVRFRCRGFGHKLLLGPAEQGYGRAIFPARASAFRRR